MFKVDNKKDTREASINAIQVSLWLAYNIFLKSMIESGEPVVSNN